MRDLHQVVIYDVRQVVRRKVVGGLVQHLVVQDVRVDHNLAANQIVHMHLFVRLYQKTHYILITAFHAFVHLGLRQGQRVYHLTAGTRIVLEVWHLLTLGFQLCRRVKRYISMVAVQQLLHILVIDISAFALSVRTMLAHGFYLFLSIG